MLLLLFYCLLAVFSLLVLYLTFLIWAQKKLYSHLPGSEPEGIIGFFLGNASKVMIRRSGSNFLKTFEKEFQIHRTSTFKFRLVFKTVVVTKDPKIIKAVMIDEDCPKHTGVYKLFHSSAGVRFIKAGLGTLTSKEKWREQRTFFNPCFHKQCLKEFTNEFNEKGNRMVDYLRKASEKSKDSISLFKVFNHAAFDSIASIAFGIDIDSFNNPDTLFASYLEKVFNNLLVFLADPVIKFKPWKWSFMNEQKKMIEYIREYGRKQIQSRIDNLKNGEDLRDDLLTIILKASSGEEIDMEAMIDNFVLFFFAGQETIAVALSSTFLGLGKSPDVLEKLRREIDEVIGKKAQIEYDDLSKLKYTEAVFKESLRLYAPVAFYVRENERDINVDGVFIPKKSQIILHAFCAARNEEVFEDPFEFKPERFLNNDLEKSAATYSNIPFSVGPRNCIGLNFAKNFDFQLASGQSFELIEKMTIQPKDGTKCFVSLRT